VIAVDTNVLIYAHRRDSEWHSSASRRLKELAEGAAPWAIPWHCIHEFLSVATHPGILDPPSTPDEAIGQVEAWLEAPTLALLTEGSGHWHVLRELLARRHVRGARVHDARIAALCLANDVRELWTLDRDFGRFPELATHNPLVG
jgi:toxin-antitoxin system PIN domain toxin